MLHELHGMRRGRPRCGAASGGGRRGFATLAAAKLGAAAALAFVAALCIARSQPVALTTPEGCLQHAQPAPPANVQAVAKDGKVVLSWAPPTDGSCVDTYVIDAFDASLRTTAQPMPVQSSSTNGLGYTMAGLENGRAYRFRVQSYSAGATPTPQDTSSTAEIVATPSDRCLNIPPGKPVGLWVTPGSGMAQLCWLGVDNDACVDEYRVGAVRADSQFRSQVGDAPISKGGCANISRLEDGVRYTFSVVPYTATYGEGPASQEESFVGTSDEARAGWTCVRQPACRPNTLSLCSVVGCQSLSRGLGSCKGPAMFDIDHLHRQVTQWCSDVCVCDLSVATAFSPLSWGVINGVTQSASQLAGVAAPPASQATSPGGATSAALLPAQLLPSMVQGAANGLVDSISKGATLGNGLAANVLGGMMQNTAASGVLGQSLGDAIGSAASTVVSNVANNVIDGLVGSLTSAG